MNMKKLILENDADRLGLNRINGNTVLLIGDSDVWLILKYPFAQYCSIIHLLLKQGTKH